MRFNPVLLAIVWGGTACTQVEASTEEVEGLQPVSYQGTFWEHWGDGRAELASYELTFPRYGEQRDGLAVTIFVTEPFSESARVKADPGRPAEDTYQVLKLNLVRDFQTGIYDYNLMTSAFIALEDRHGRVAGTPTKISFSSQEWCGNAYHQLVFDAERVHQVRHSYFDGEGDLASSLEHPADAMSEDTLLVWARGLAAPRLEPGQKRPVSMLMSTAWSRLQHQPLGWLAATVSRDSQPTTLTIANGPRAADVHRAVLENGRSWTIYTETTAPHRVLGWETSDGESARLIKSERLKYWELHDEGDERRLGDLGLRRRELRAP